MKESGEAVDKIAAFTGLGKEEIQKIKIKKG